MNLIQDVILKRFREKLLNAKKGLESEGRELPTIYRYDRKIGERFYSLFKEYVIELKGDQEKLKQLKLHYEEFWLLADYQVNAYGDESYLHTFEALGNVLTVIRNDHHLSLKLLDNYLESTSLNTESKASSSLSPSSLEWKLSKIQLAELIKALHLSGGIKDSRTGGNAKLEDIEQALCSAFNTSISDVHKSLKKSYQPFEHKFRSEQLREHLLIWLIDELQKYKDR